MQIALGKTAPVVNGQQVTYSTELLKLEYQYGDLDWDGSVIAGSNNGNVAKQTITVAGVGATPGFTAVQNYDYDPLNRIQIASETLTPTSGTPETWTQEFRYYRYGTFPCGGRKAGCGGAVKLALLVIDLHCSKSIQTVIGNRCRS